VTHAEVLYESKNRFSLAALRKKDLDNLIEKKKKSISVEGAKLIGIERNPAKI